MNRWAASREKVEKVVKPPQRPVFGKRVSLGSRRVFFSAQGHHETVDHGPPPLPVRRAAVVGDVGVGQVFVLEGTFLRHDLPHRVLIQVREIAVGVERLVYLGDVGRAALVQRLSVDALAPDDEGVGRGGGQGFVQGVENFRALKSKGGVGSQDKIPAAF